jgi:hypothetical protein
MKCGFVVTESGERRLYLVAYVDQGSGDGAAKPQQFRVLDADGHDLGVAREAAAQWRVRSPQLDPPV